MYTYKYIYIYSCDFVPIPYFVLLDLFIFSIANTQANFQD